MEDYNNHKWYLELEQNGGEYTGCMYITAEKVKQITDKIFLADGVVIELDEMIMSITRMKK